VATTGKDTSSSQVNIVTYDLVARKATYLQDKHFQVVIAAMLISYFVAFLITFRGRHGRDFMVVGFTTTCAISAYYH
jgi:hypothetical protein